MRYLLVDPSRALDVRLFCTRSDADRTREQRTAAREARERESERTKERAREREREAGTLASF